MVVFLFYVPFLATWLSPLLGFLITTLVVCIHYKFKGKILAALETYLAYGPGPIPKPPGIAVFMDAPMSNACFVSRTV